MSPIGTSHDIGLLQHLHQLIHSIHQLRDHLCNKSGFASRLTCLFFITNRTQTKSVGPSIINSGFTMATDDFQRVMPMKISPFFDGEVSSHQKIPKLDLCHSISFLHELNLNFPIMWIVNHSKLSMVIQTSDIPPSGPIAIQSHQTSLLEPTFSNANLYFFMVKSLFFHS